jgi:DNA-directed RNA polymerase III subunit RPC6
VKLDDQQAMVYEQIEDSGGDGIWLKTIRTRLNMHESVVNAAVKHLEKTLHYIRVLDNVANSHRRMYIKVGVKQSERSTGGPWYTDGELDEAFVEAISDVLWTKILESSVQMSKAGRHAIDKLSKKKAAARENAQKRAQKEAKKAPKKGVKIVTPEEALAMRNKALGITAVDPKVAEQEAEMRYREQKTLYEEFLPYPAGYKGYQTLDPLTEHVLDCGVCSEEVVLSAVDIAVVLEIMMLDKRIEEADCGKEIGYKVTRQSLKPVQDAFNVFAEAPCGRCPVFNLCEEGGPVGPHNCEYFTEWLA